MNPVWLDQLRLADHRLKKKRHQRGAMLFGQSGIDRIERIGMISPEIGRRQHPHDHHRDLAGGQLGQQLIEVRPGLLRRKPAQHIVPAQADDDQRRRHFLAAQHEIQPLESARRGIAGNPGVGDLRIDPARPQRRFQPGGIALVRLYAIACEQAVPQRQNGHLLANHRQVRQGRAGAFGRHRCGLICTCP